MVGKPCHEPCRTSHPEVSAALVLRYLGGNIAIISRNTIQENTKTVKISLESRYD